MTSQLNQVFTKHDELVNRGSSYENVGAKQKKRKLAQFKKAVDAALGSVSPLALFQHTPKRKRTFYDINDFDLRTIGT